jgi:hypothetical protein
MWEEYDRFSFPVSTEDGELMGELRRIYFYVRKAVGRKTNDPNGLVS